MNDQRTYTLVEAQRELARIECLNRGHSYSVVSARDLRGVDIPIHVACSVCGKTWPVERETRR